MDAPRARTLGTVLGTSTGVAATGIATSVERMGGRISSAPAPVGSGRKFRANLAPYSSGWDVLYGATPHVGGGLYWLTVPVLGRWRVTWGFDVSCGADPAKWSAGAAGPDGSGVGRGNAIKLDAYEGAPISGVWVGTLGTAPNGDVLACYVGANPVDASGLPVTTGSWTAEVEGELLERGIG